MKKTFYSFLLISFFILNGCSVNPPKLEEFKIKIKENSNCTNDLHVYYEDNKNKIYLQCIDEVEFVQESDTFTLKEYITKNNLTIKSAINNIVSKFNLKESLFDGGTNVYQNSDFNIAIIECNTLEGNQDVYIGNKNMEFQNYFCK